MCNVYLAYYGRCSSCLLLMKANNFCEKEDASDYPKNFILIITSSHEGLSTIGGHQARI